MSKVTTVSSKMPASLVAEVDRIARFRAVSRSHLLRELADALVDGRTRLEPSPALRAMSLRDLGASDVGRAALERTRDVGPLAHAGGPVACEVDPAAHEVDLVGLAYRLASGGKR